MTRAAEALEEYGELYEITGLSGPVERAAIVLDTTATLGTPEVIYRLSHGESVAAATARLRREVMAQAHAALHNALHDPDDPDWLAKVLWEDEYADFVRAGKAAWYETSEGKRSAYRARAAAVRAAILGESS